MPQPNRFVTARLSLRKGPTEQWEIEDPVLYIGEPAWDISKNQLKIGDGTRKWSQLPYIENLGGPEPWINDNSGLFPDYIEEQADAINYTKFHHDLWEDNAEAYFQAGIDQDPFVPLYEVSVRSNTGGAASIDGSPRKFNTYELGDEVQITAVVFNPYQFDGWEGLKAGEENTQTTTITIDGARDVVATFRYG
jgi:hypothetical protein